MAALTAGCSTTAVVGLSGSSITGKKLAIKSARPVSMKAPRRVGVATAKYDIESSLYFDLGDLGNTTGNWDLYGSDGPAPYNSMQSKFFETFGGAFTKRGLLLKFLILGGAGALGYASTTASGSILAIKNGPKSTPTPGPNGKI